jgi:hypothetical protein
MIVGFLEFVFFGQNAITFLLGAIESNFWRSIDYDD